MRSSARSGDLSPVSPRHKSVGQNGSPTHPALDCPPEEPAKDAGGLDRVVFGVTAVIAIAFLVWGFISTESLASVSGKSLSWVMANLGWLFVTAASTFVGFVLWLAFGKFGNIPLGRDGEEPEFRTVSWITMM